MKKTNWKTIALLALVIGTTIPTLTSCKTSGQVANSGQTVKYTCPMHSEVVQDTPGNCPICGMTLVQSIHTASSNTH
jgi:Cu(I)/Ag(I) efflux system membrane fusion protein